MKVTLVKGNGGSHKLVELQAVVEMLKDEKRKNAVLSLRQSIPYCSPGSRPVEAGKIPSVIFSSG